MWVLTPDHREAGITRLLPPGRAVLPNRCGVGPTLARTGSLAIDFTPGPHGVRLRVRSHRVDADISVERSDNHEALGVVVPWSRRRFQYTVKENTLPATGTVSVDGRTYPVGGRDAWATLDFGRGRWPYRVTWNWGSGSGRVVDDGRERVVGLQLGGKWTDGTGVTENALTVDGVLHKISEQLVWDYDNHDWLAPWRVRTPRTGRVDLTFRPDYERADTTELGVLGNRTHQCFGTWFGTVADDDGRRLRVDGVRGWAEEVRNRW